jgi:transcriptional regulator with XRE-family HTH domain
MAFFLRHESGTMIKPAPKPRKQFKKTYVREWRKHRGLTLERLADRIGMKASALSYLERGQSAYTQGTLELLADALQTTPASLIMRDPSADDAIWSIWENASEGERRQITEVAKALKRAV